METGITDLGAVLGQTGVMSAPAIGAAVLANYAIDVLAVTGWRLMNRVEQLAFGACVFFVWHAFDKLMA